MSEEVRAREYREAELRSRRSMHGMERHGNTRRSVNGKPILAFMQIIHLCIITSFATVRRQESGNTSDRVSECLAC